MTDYPLAPQLNESATPTRQHDDQVSLTHALKWCGQRIARDLLEQASRSDKEAAVAAGVHHADHGAVTAWIATHRHG